MSNHSAADSTPGRTVVHVLLMQLAIGACLGLVAWPLAGADAGRWLFLGTIVGVVPNAWLGMRLTGFGKLTDGPAVMRAAWAGEFGKVALTVLLLAIVFAFLQPNRPGWFLGGFIAVQLSSWLALLVFRRG